MIASWRACCVCVFWFVLLVTSSHVPAVETKAAQNPIRPWPDAVWGNKRLNRPRSRPHDKSPNSPSSESLHSRPHDTSPSLSSPSSSPNVSSVSSLPATMPERTPASAGAASAGHPTAPHRMPPPGASASGRSRTRLRVAGTGIAVTVMAPRTMRAWMRALLETVTWY